MDQAGPSSNYGVNARVTRRVFKDVRLVDRTPGTLDSSLLQLVTDGAGCSR